MYDCVFCRNLCYVLLDITLKIFPYWKYLVAVMASLVAQMVKNLPAMQVTQLQSLSQEDPLEKGMAPTPVFLPEENSCHEQRSLVV